jgi:hypothetical protein
MPKLGVLGRNSAKELILQYTDTVVAEREREREREKERDRTVTRPTVQSMAALALVTAPMAHLKKGGELSSADANNILERASSLLNELSLSFNDVTKADEVFVRKIMPPGLGA